MKKTATVLEIINSETAKIQLHKFNKYKQLRPDEKQTHSDSIFEAYNPIRAKEGEVVEVNIKKKFSAAELTFTYILPVLAFIGGMFLTGVYFADAELKPVVAMVVALASVGASLMVGSIYKTKTPSIYIFTIVKRIEPVETQ